MSTTAPAGPLSLAVENLRRLVSESSTFQAWSGAGDATAALDNVHRVSLPKPAGERYTLDELKKLRPFAIVDLFRGSNAFQANRESDSGGFERYRTGWRLRVMFEAAVPAECKDDFAEAELRFLNQVGGVVADMLALAGGDDLLMISNLTVLDGPNRSDPAEDSSEGDFHNITLLIQAGS